MLQSDRFTRLNREAVCRCQDSQYCRESRAVLGLIQGIFGLFVAVWESKDFAHLKLKIGFGVLSEASNFVARITMVVTEFSSKTIARNILFKFST